MSGDEFDTPIVRNLYKGTNMAVMKMMHNMVWEIWVKKDQFCIVIKVSLHGKAGNFDLYWFNQQSEITKQQFHCLVLHDAKKYACILFDCGRCRCIDRARGWPNIGENLTMMSLEFPTQTGSQKTWKGRKTIGIVRIRHLPMVTGIFLLHESNSFLKFRRSWAHCGLPQSTMLTVHCRLRHDSMTPESVTFCVQVQIRVTSKLVTFYVQVRNQEENVPQLEALATPLSGRPR